MDVVVEERQFGRGGKDRERDRPLHTILMSGDPLVALVQYSSAMWCYIVQCSLMSMNSCCGKK